MFWFRTFNTLAILSVAAAAVAQDVSPGAKAAAADPYTVPRTDDTTILADFIRAILGDRPANFADVVALSSKMPTVMEAAERILALEKDESSKPYRLAKRLMLQRVEVVRVAQRGTPEEQQALLDEVFHFLSAADRTEDDAGLAMKLAISLESWGSKEVALAAYGRLGQLLATSKVRCRVPAFKTLCHHLRPTALRGLCPARFARQSRFAQRPSPA